jgi:hypothetical protein
MITCRKLASTALALLVVSATFVAAEDPPGRKYGMLTYPARGNLHLDEGSLEMWLSLDFDAKDKTIRCMPFDLLFEGGSHCVLMMIARYFAFIGYVVPQQSYVWSERVEWKPGEPHHLAVTWSGRKRSVFLDGRVGKGTPDHGVLQGEGRVDTSQDVIVEDSLFGDLTTARMWFGYKLSPITLDEIRISSVARPVEEIQKTMGAAPKADVTTLLLDHCDGGPAEVISGYSGEKGAVQEGVCRLVDAKHGKGIALWSDDKK